MSDKKKGFKVGLQDVRVFRCPSCGSDIFWLILKYYFHMWKITEENNEKLEKPEIRITPRFNTELLEDDSILYRKRLNEKQTENAFDTTEKQYKYVVENIRMATKKALGGKEAEAKGNYYWNKEIKEDVDDKRVKYLKWLSKKRFTDKISYKKAQPKVIKKVTEEKNKYWEQTRQRIQSYIWGRLCLKVWRTLKIY